MQNNCRLVYGFTRKSSDSGDRHAYHVICLFVLYNFYSRCTCDISGQPIKLLFIFRDKFKEKEPLEYIGNWDENDETGIFNYFIPGFT